MEEKSIAVNPDACITCGTCMDACNHAARDYEDDTDAFHQYRGYHGRKGEKL